MINKKAISIVVLACVAFTIITTTGCSSSSDCKSGETCLPTCASKGLSACCDGNKWTASALITPKCWGKGGSCSCGSRKCEKPNCLSENDEILTQTGDTKLLKEVVIGDYIFDGDLFTKVLTVEYGPKQEMIQLFLLNIKHETNNTTVTLTENHLLYDDNNKLIKADQVEVGSIIYDNFMVYKIGYDQQYSSSPITFSGYLQVNGVKVSSYIIDEHLAKLAHKFLSIFRWSSENINEQITGNIAEWIALDAPNKYYLPLREILGKDTLDNELYFNIIAAVVVPIIICKNIFGSVQMLVLTTAFIGLISYNTAVIYMTQIIKLLLSIP